MTTDTRYTMRVAVYILLIKDNKILLLRRAHTGWNDGLYSTPAGHLDGNEPLRTAAAREAKEEVGVTIRPEDLDVVHVMHLQSNYEYISFFLQAKTWTGEPHNVENDKHDDVQWFPLDGLPTNLSENLQAALDHYQEGVFFSEKGWTQ